MCTILNDSSNTKSKAEKKPHINHSFSLLLRDLEQGISSIWFSRYGIFVNYDVMLLYPHGYVIVTHLVVRWYTIHDGGRRRQTDVPLWEILPIAGRNGGFVEECSSRK